MPRSKGRGGAAYNTARRRVLAASQICWICLEAIDMTLPHTDPRSATVDHVVPVSKLGPNDPLLWSPHNLRPAHLDCNARRGAGDRPTKKVTTSRNWFA
jgi:5-methylcytosine-specific restriction endonuclease McrA